MSAALSPIVQLAGYVWLSLTPQWGRPRDKLENYGINVTNHVAITDTSHQTPIVIANGHLTFHPPNQMGWCVLCVVSACTMKLVLFILSNRWCNHMQIKLARFYSYSRRVADCLNVCTAASALAVVVPDSRVL